VQHGLTAATFAQRRQLVELLIDRVIVTDGDVEIRYVVPTHPRAEQTRFCHLRLDYRAGPTAVKQHVKPMLRFERFAHVAVTLSGIELAHQFKKDQFDISTVCSSTDRAPEVWEAVLAV
jgi:hypothetical protein